MAAWRVRVAMAVVAGGVLAGCTAGPSNRPDIVTNDGGSAPTEQTVAPDEVPPLEENKSTVDWRRCSGEVRDALTAQQIPASLPVECGRINGVLDSPYAPDRGSARIQLLRAGEGKVPIVVVNDVDGLPGTIYAAKLAAALPPAFFDKFQLIGMDRRGTGNSAAVNCLPPAVRRAMVEADPAALDVTGWLDTAQTAGQQCSLALARDLPAMDTWRTAADLDVLRTALGVGRLNAIGHGEGSRVISMFADRFPERVGRLVLDGVPDPSPDAQIALEGVAKGGEAAWDAFAADCVQRACELGADPERTLLELLGQLRETPIASPALDVTAGSALHAVRTGLADRKAWPTLSKALAQARDGDATGIVDLLTAVYVGTDAQAPALDGAIVTACNDTRTRLSADQITKTAEEWHKQFPIFGGLTAQQLAQCGPWTIPDHPLPTPTGRGAPPILVLATANDAVTPLDGTSKAAQQLDSGVLLTWQGGGHGAVGVSPCATTAAVNFLTDAAVPRDGTVCPP